MYGLLLLVALAPPAHVPKATLADGTRAELRRGAPPVLLVVPKRGDGWIDLARRYARNGAQGAGELAAANAPAKHPLRDVRVALPWVLASGAVRFETLRALFPSDRVTASAWEHVIVAPWGGEGESWLELSQLFLGAAEKYSELRDANPAAPLFPARGSTVVIPLELLDAELRAALPAPRRPTVAGATRPKATPGSAPAAAPAATPIPTPTPQPVSAPTPPAAPVPAATTTTVASPSTTVMRGESAPGPLEYGKDVAIYRLQPGEALYSAVVVRFTGQLHASDVNATAAELARLSGVKDVTAIPVGFPVRIPFDVLLPEFLPPGDPRRREWEKEREELAAIRRVIRAANLDGIHVILDAGHGGADTGAVAGGLWESTYVYDVMARLKNVLERETKATVWTLVRDTRIGWRTPDVDVLPQSRTQELLVEPPYDLGESSTGVHLRWVLTDSILDRLKRQRVDPERVVFVSIHADSLHPAVRGLMVYVPARHLRPRRAAVPAGLFRCREVSRLGPLRFTTGFLSRAEALSSQLGDAIARKAAQFNLPVHAFEPVRSSVLRGRSRWVPAVLRYSEVPTSVLVEICNLNNDEDRALLTTWRFREKLAHAIAAGLAEGFSR